MRWMLFFLMVFTIVPFNPPAYASDRKAKKILLAEANKIQLAEAKHYRVDDGVFELEFGKSIDLTDRKILLSVQKNRRGGCCNTYLNGDSASTRGIGKRIDLKREKSTRAFVSDKRVCFLDLIDAAIPSGANGFVTYRLHCL